MHTAGGLCFGSGHMRRLVQLEPARTVFWERLGEVYELQGRAEAAIELYEKLLKQQSDAASLAKRLDALYATVPEITTDGAGITATRALSFWDSLAGQNPHNAMVQVYWGAALERAGNLSAAREVYRKALDISPEYAEALYRSGALEVLEGDGDTGLAQILNAASRDPGLAGAISRRCDQLASSLVERKRYADAMRVYQTALEISPQDLWPRVHQGELYELLNEDASATDCYRAVLMSSPDSPVTAKRLDALLRRQPAGQELALTEWRAITERYPDAAIPALYLGIALESVGDTDGAVAAYRKSQRLNPDLSDAREKLSALEGRNKPQ